MHAPARLSANAAVFALSEVPRSCVAHARVARVLAWRPCFSSPGCTAVAPRAAHVRSARTATRVAPLPPAAARDARRRRGMPAPCAASALDAALPYDAVFGNAAAVVAEARAASSGSLLLLRSRTARMADSLASGDDDAEPGDELQLFAMDESVAEAAASMAVDVATAAAALLECQWSTVLAQHASATASAAARPLAIVAGIAVAVGELAAGETARLRAADAAFRSGLEAQLAALGAPPRLAATSATAGGAAWLSRLESALDLAECVEQDAVTWPGAAAVLLPGAAAEDAALLNALNALLPRAAAAAEAAAGADGEGETVAPDGAGALALAPWLEGACDRGLAAAARALGAEAHRRVAANEWRMAARFAAAEEGSAPRAPLLVLLLPVGADGKVAPEHATVAARVAESRAKAKLPPPLLAAWGEPAAQAQGGEALRARRDKLVRAAADAVADALAKAS